MATKTKVAIIGLGSIGSVIANNLSKSNSSFIVSGRNLEQVVITAKRWGSLVEVYDCHKAIELADIIILAIPYAEFIPFMGHYATALEGKIIVDPSNPIALDEQGNLHRLVGETETANQFIAEQLPAGATLVKAFGTLEAGSLQSKAYATPLQVLFYAGDCPEANAKVEDLIKNTGFAPLYIGGLTTSKRIEVGGDLHEFGPLGKTVAIDEAKALI